MMPVTHSRIDNRDGLDRKPEGRLGRNLSTPPSGHV
jgi:hypothetical protein